MAHRHFCDVAGHEWECEGTALRPLRGDTEPSVCICEIHRTPLVDGDHSGCSIELLACPEHRDVQRQMTAEERASGEAYIEQLFAERDALPEGSAERLAVADKMFVFTISGGRER
jgi:hypothetical protein